MTALPQETIATMPKQLTIPPELVQLVRIAPGMTEALKDPRYQKLREALLEQAEAVDRAYTQVRAEQRLYMGLIETWHEAVAQEEH
jgi:hypothetical protein